MPLVQSAKIITGTGGFVNKRMSGDHENYRTIKIDPNTDKSQKDLRRLALT